MKTQASATLQLLGRVALVAGLRPLLRAVLGNPLAITELTWIVWHEFHSAAREKGKEKP